MAMPRPACLSGGKPILAAEPSYCPDDNTTSDHRPVLAEFGVEAPADSDLRDQALHWLESVEQELAALRRLIEEIE